ncbi:hypothetical protein VNO77_19175 [Canavalia gladiata]|uniref:Uncharacterized protein n=1 Tax=Canavalia gladiata TaxID=3824 RepID=A0AAN9LMW5_CANGL
MPSNHTSRWAMLRLYPLVHIPGDLPLLPLRSSMAITLSRCRRVALLNFEAPSNLLCHDAPNLEQRRLMGSACHGVLRRLVLGDRPSDLSPPWKYESPGERVYGHELDVRTKVSRLYLPTLDKALGRSWLHDRM